MSRVQELISVLAEKEIITRALIAKADRICKICGEPAILFRTSRAELEYSLSSICQSCQDYYFPKEQWTHFPNFPIQYRPTQGYFYSSSRKISGKCPSLQIKPETVSVKVTANPSGSLRTTLPDTWRILSKLNNGNLVKIGCPTAIFLSVLMNKPPAPIFFILSRKRPSNTMYSAIIYAVRRGYWRLFGKPRPLQTCSTMSCFVGAIQKPCNGDGKNERQQQKHVRKDSYTCQGVGVVW